MTTPKESSENRKPKRNRSQASAKPAPIKWEKDDSAFDFGAFGHPGISETGQNAQNPLAQPNPKPIHTPAALAVALRSHQAAFTVHESPAILALEALAVIAGKCRTTADIIALGAAMRLSDAVLRRFGL